VLVSQHINGGGMGARNDFYRMVDAYLKNRPDASAAEAWGHFLNLARTGFVAAIVAADPDGNWIEIAPDIERVGTKQIKRSAFIRRCSFIRKDINQ